jgi:hypothetical protein
MVLARAPSSALASLLGGALPVTPIRDDGRPRKARFRPMPDGRLQRLKGAW